MQIGFDIGMRVPEVEIENFVQALSIIFDCTIRDAIENREKMNTIDEICDLIIQKFILKGNYGEKLDELKKFKKKN